MKYKLYESYGMLAHEKKPIYSDMIPATDAYNVINVIIPDEYPISSNAYGDTLIDIGETTFLLSEVLSNYGDKPCLKWHDGHNYHRVPLEII